MSMVDDGSVDQTRHSKDRLGCKAPSSETGAGPVSVDSEVGLGRLGYKARLG